MKKISQQKQRGLQFYSMQQPKDLNARRADLRKEGLSRIRSGMAQSGHDTSLFISGYARTGWEKPSLLPFTLSGRSMKHCLFARKRAKPFDGKRSRSRQALVTKPSRLSGTMAMASMRGGTHLSFGSTVSSGSHSPRRWMDRRRIGSGKRRMVPNWCSRHSCVTSIATSLVICTCAFPPGMVPSGAPVVIEVQGKARQPGLVYDLSAFPASTGARGTVV